MKQVLIFLALAATAYGSNSRKLMQKYVENARRNEAVEEAFALDTDFTCIMKGAMTQQDCEEASGACTWCPIGSFAGFCVSADQGTAINSVQMPHMQCGGPPSAEDTRFWNGLITCEMASVTEETCVGNGDSGCTWCTVDEPHFGICVSEEFYDLAKELEDPDDPIKLEDVLKCSTENRDTGAEGLLDFSCVMLTGPETISQCATTPDASGLPCETLEDDEMGEFCVTPTQKGLYDFAMDFLDGLGIDLDAIMEDPTSVLENPELVQAPGIFLGGGAEEQDEESDSATFEDEFNGGDRN